MNILIAVQFDDKDIDHQSIIETLLIGVEGAKTPAGSADAQGRIGSLKKLALELFHNSSPRKAKRLERKSTAPSHL
jgi:hypothetical protein